jgi:Holliday junction resolvasome RuvABC endonuclease subunit
MAVVLGIDASSKKIAFTYTSPSSPNRFRAYVLSSGKVKTLACRDAYNFIYTVLDDYVCFGDTVHVFLERLLVAPGRIGATVPQAQVAGAVMAAVGEFQGRGVATLQFAQVGSWKKLVVGSGSASKEQVASHLKRRWPQAYKFATTPGGKIDQDIIDSACINIYGRLALGHHRTPELRCPELLSPRVRMPTKSKSR